MILFPTVDIKKKKAVRLLQGDYSRMTVYEDDPLNAALRFRYAGSEWIHIVDLEGARDGETPNFDTVLRIKEKSGLRAEIGGGIRTMETVDRYLSAGLDRVILGTAALEDDEFLRKALIRYEDRIAVGVDVLDGNR